MIPPPPMHAERTKEQERMTKTSERETFNEQIERVRLMAQGDPAWDLSDNDTAALQTLLDVSSAVVGALRAIDREMGIYMSVEDGAVYQQMRAALAKAEDSPR